MRDQSKANLKVKAGVNKLIEKHPESFNCLIYKPDPTTLEKTAQNSDVVGAIEHKNRNLEYLDPVESKALKMPDQFQHVATLSGEPGDTGENVITLLILDPDVSEQSVIQYREYVKTGESRVVNLYIMDIEPVGEAPAVMNKYHCVPFYSEEGNL